MYLAISRASWRCDQLAKGSAGWMPLAECFVDWLEGQELSHASTHSINHERWWHSGYDCSGDLVRGADDDLRWVRPTPGIHCVYERVQSKSGNATKGHHSILL